MISVNSWLFLLVVIFLNYDFDNKKSSCVDAFFDASKYRSRPGIIIAGQNLLQASANNNNNGNNNLNIVNGNRNNVNNRNNKINNRNNANNSNNKNRKNNKRPTLNQNQSRVKNNNNNNTKTNQVKRPKNLQIINVKLSQFDLMETKRLNETYSILNKLKNYDYYITQDLTPTEPDISAPDYQYPDSNENIQPPPNLYPIPQEYPILNSQYDPAIDIIPVTVSSQPTTIAPINKVNNNNQDNSNNEDYSDQGYIYPQPQYNNLQYGQKIYTQQLPPLSTPSYNFQQQNHLSNNNNIDKNVPESSPILTTPTLQLNNYEYKIQTSTSSYDRNYDYNHVTPLIEQQQKTVSAKSYDNSYYPPIKYNIPAFRPLKPIYYPQTAPDIKKQQQQQQQQQYQYQHQSQQPRLLNKSPTAVQANSNIGEHDHSKEQLINRETNYYSSFLFNSSPDKIGSSIFGYPLIGLFEPNSNLNFWNILGRRKRTSRKT